MENCSGHPESNTESDYAIVVGPKSRITRELARQLRRQLTPTEARLWEWLRRNYVGGLHFRKQQIIDRFIADFYCHAARLVVEVDGKIHETTAEYDAERTEALERRGLKVIRFTAWRVEKDLSAVLDEIRCAAQQRLPVNYVAKPRRSAVSRRR